jgi:uncharacterized protein (DUF885 family)
LIARASLVYVVALLASCSPSCSPLAPPATSPSNCVAAPDGGAPAADEANVSVQPAPLPSFVPDTPLEHTLAQLLQDAWEARLAYDPVYASSIGDRRHNDRWPERTEEAFAREHARTLAFLDKLHAIPRAELAPPSQLNWDLFERQYTLQAAAYDFGFDTFRGGFRYAPITQMDGVQTDGDAARRLRFETKRDYEDWLRRMETFPAYVDQTMALMREGMKRKMLFPRAVLQRVTSQLDRLLALAPEDSPFFSPFTRIPASIPEADRARYAVAAKYDITTRILPAYRTFRDFFDKEYLPACFDPAVGMWQMPRGDELYAFLARYHTTTTLGVDEIHEIGLREVARIRGEMQTRMASVGFKGTLKDFFAKLRTDPRFFYKTPAELEEAYRATAKRIDPTLVKLFKTLPRTPYGVEPVPANVAPDATTAYYVEPSADGSRAGTYFVNLYKPEARPIWEMMALTMHESVPGHHLQMSLAEEHSGTPAFRRNLGPTAFVEGWALYAESLGDEVGLYDDPYSKFGQLAYEMWRAIRLVVDTGIHARKWDRQKAIDFFVENDPKAVLDVTNEIDRYIVNPGQALAYEVGALKLKELRAKATAELGDRFDVRTFHDAVLEEGAVPLDVLEKHIDAFIEREKNAPPR